MDLKDKIHKKTAKIGVIGLGYVGLPLSLEFASKNFKTTGFDIDQTKIDFLQGLLYEELFINK